MQVSAFLSQSVLERHAPRQHAFAPNEWGTFASRHSVEGAPHVSLSLLRVPEGLVLLCRCTLCGARHDALVDLRKEPSSDLPAKALGALDADWGTRHQGCAAQPVRFQLPHSLRTLASGQAATGAHPRWFLLSTSALFEVEVANLTGAHRSRTGTRIEIQTRLASLRRWARAERQDLIGAALLEASGETHTWSIATPDFGVILRRRGSVGEAVPLTRGPLADDLPLLDGALAPAD